MGEMDTDKESTTEHFGKQCVSRLCCKTGAVNWPFQCLESGATLSKTPKMLPQCATSQPPNGQCESGPSVWDFGQWDSEDPAGTLYTVEDP